MRRDKKRYKKEKRVMLRGFLSEDFTCTKRQLGAVLLVAGAMIVMAMAAGELFVSTSAGIGIMQRLGFVVGGVSAAVGLTLLPLGNRPA
jgi:hypothetical protein